MIFFKTTLAILLVAGALALPSQKSEDLLAQEESSFGLNLLSHLDRQNGGLNASNNTVIAPAGIRNLLAMLWMGAHGKTAGQIYQAIGDPTSDDPARASSEHHKVHSFLAIQTFTKPAFDQKYLNLLRSKYHATVHNATYHTYVNIWAQADINQWVSEHTRDSITKFINNPYNMPYQTKLVAATASQLYARWGVPFPFDHTYADYWYFNNGSTKWVDLMYVAWGHKLNYAKFDDGELLEVPFKDGLRLLAFKPNKDKLVYYQSISQLFASVPLAQRVAALKPTKVNAGLPRFQEIETAAPLSGYSIASAIKELGITEAFVQGSADFHGIDGARDLYLNDLWHKATLKWNQNSAQGSSGSADKLQSSSAWGVVMDESEFAAIDGGATQEEKSIDVKFDHPFAFLIQDVSTSKHSTVFAGVINDPTPGYNAQSF